MMRRLMMMVAAVALLPACAATPAAEDYTPPARHFINDNRAAAASEQFAVYDPAEGVNRRIYKFNAGFDRYVFIPIVDVYDTVIPEYVNDRFVNFFSNLGEFRNATNAALQGRPKQTLKTALRFTVNSTVGLLGLYDPAASMGLKQHREDFGQTLGVWGLDSGAYVMLPILGPSSVRDTVGKVVDIAAFSWVMPDGIEDEDAYKGVRYGLEPVHERANTDFRYHATGSPFEYELVRFVTTETRRLDVEE